MSDIQPAPKFPFPRREPGQPSLPAEVPIDVPEPARPRDTSLFGQTVRKGRSFPVGALVFSLLALAIAIIALLTRKWEPLPASLLPAAIAVALYVARRPAFELRLTPEGIELVGREKRWSYDDLQGVYRGRKSCFIFYRGGFLTVPLGTSPSPDELCEFLDSQPTSDDVNPSPPAELQAYLKPQETLYGANRVWVFRPRAEFERSQDGAVGLAIGLAGAATGAVWMLISIAAGPAWLALGIIAFITGLVLAGIFALIRTVRAAAPKASLRAGLIVSPGGCALVQGALRGELKWNELRKITHNQRADFFTGQKGLVLHLDGAIVPIGNFYHRPNSYIHDLITDLWDEFGGGGRRR